jgi:hypothetical protein
MSRIGHIDESIANITFILKFRTNIVLSHMKKVQSP